MLRDRSASPEVRLIELERRRIVASLIADLPPRCGEVMHCRYLTGMSCSETARNLDISVSGVERQVTLGRSKLMQRRDDWLAGLGLDDLLEGDDVGGGRVVGCLKGTSALISPGALATDYEKGALMNSLCLSMLTLLLGGAFFAIPFTVAQSTTSPLGFELRTNTVCASPTCSDLCNPGLFPCAIHPETGWVCLGPPPPD